MNFQVSSIFNWFSFKFTSKHCNLIILIFRKFYNFFRAGDVADSMYVVLSGRLRSVEKKTVVEEFGRGDVLGMVRLFFLIYCYFETLFLFWFFRWRSFKRSLATRQFWQCDFHSSPGFPKACSTSTNCSFLRFFFFFLNF